MYLENRNFERTKQFNFGQEAPIIRTVESPENSENQF